MQKHKITAILINDFFSIIFLLFIHRESFETIINGEIYRYRGGEWIDSILSKQ